MVLNKEEVISIYDNLKTMSFKDIVDSGKKIYTDNHMISTIRSYSVHRNDTYNSVPGVIPLSDEIKKKLKNRKVLKVVEESDYIMILNKGLYVGDGLDKTKIFIEPNEDHVDTYMVTYFLSEVSNVNGRIISANGTSFLISKQTIEDLKDKGMSKNSIKSLKYIPRFA